MKTIAVLLTKKYRPLSIAAILDVFETVNSYYQEQEGQPYFDIRLVRTDDDIQHPNLHDGYEPVTLSSIDNSHLILIPAFTSTGDMATFVQDNHAFIPWICEQYETGSEIASFCTGAFLLAATGLLNGRKATTHVNAARMFAHYFPEVLLQEDKVVTDDNGIYTSGGATSTFHLLLYLLEKYCRKETAIRTAKVFAIDMDRELQSYFADFVPSRHHNDSLVQEAQQRMEQRFQEGCTVEELIHDLPASRRNFIRRFKIATGITPIEYLQRLRIEAAKKLLEGSDCSITEVMFQSGYNDAKAFRLLFSRLVGITPRSYREKYAGKKLLSLA